MIPVGAVIAESHLWAIVGLSFPMSASSYAGNALAACVGCATIDGVSGSLLTACRRRGVRLLEAARRCAVQHPKVVRGAEGLGLLIGVECTTARVAKALTRALIARGVLMFTAFANGAVVMIEPPLVISEQQVEFVSESLMSAAEDLERHLERVGS